MPNKILLEIAKSALLEDGITPFETQDQTIAICKMGDDYYAFPDTCSHEEWPLSESYMNEGLIVCSLHGATFDPRTGACKRGPATEPLIPYTVRQDAETLFVELETA